MHPVITPIRDGLYRITFPVDLLGHTNVYFTEWKKIEEHFCTQLTLYRENLKVIEFFNSSDILSKTVDALREQTELVELEADNV